MKKIALIISFTIVFISCANEGKTDSASVYGNLSNLAEGTTIYLDYLSATQITPQDTAVINSDGSYSFDNPVEKMGYYRLKITNQNFINLILNKGDAAIVNANANDLVRSYSVEGSTESLKLKEFNSIIIANSKTQDSINNIYQTNPNDQAVFIELQKASFNSAGKMNNSFSKIINENPGSLVSLAAAGQMNPEQNFELLKIVDKALSEKMPDSDYFKKFHEKIEKLSRLSIGGSAPEISLTNTQGEMISLSSLKGNIVLVDFWASWCRPCRAENPNVVAAYNKYHKDGFEVYSVSLDGMPQQQNAKQNWIDAIQNDGLIWESHVSDLKGWSSSVVALYGFEGIPFTVLLDRDGNVLGKNIRGKALQEKLAEIFE
jgi:thiol-disulfide isomerase/thioredoxin